MTTTTLMQDQLFDIAIVGGGIHGAGVAQASAAAGYRTLLLERSEWAAATSRASSKLIHGGLRYLESAQFKLVHHSLRERALLLRNAPELVRAVPFYIPVYRHTRRRPWQIRIGLSLYALLAGFQPLARFHRVPRSRWQTLPGLRTEGLQQVFQYWDAQTDDAALTRAVVQSATALTAVCMTGCELLRSETTSDHLRLHVRSGEGLWSCRARSLVNAAGPWVNDVIARCDGAGPPRVLSWVKGTHIIVPAAPKPGIFYLEAPRDGRAIFVMPWRGQTLIGTTEVEIDTPAASPTPNEIDYLLETLQFYFPQHPATVLDSFSGVRVLPADTGPAFRRARDSMLLRGESTVPILSIYGGKLTTWRHTAEQVLAALQPTLGYLSARADPRQLPLPPVD